MYILETSKLGGIRAMKKLKPAWIGFMGDGDPFDYYEKYAKMGYKAMDSEISRLPGDRAENYKRFKDLGLKCLSSWLGDFQKLSQEPDEVKKVAESVKFFDVDNVCIGGSSVISSFWLGYGNNSDYDSMMKDIEAMNKLVDMFENEGLHLTYHNHYQEFTVSYKGVSVMDYYLTQIDQRLKLKLDVGWVQVGGICPVEYMEKTKERIHLLHIKDFTEVMLPRLLTGGKEEEDFGFTAVGTGILDLKAIFAKAIDIGIEYAIVEQDRTRNLSWEDSMLCAYLNMKETGLVE